MNFEEMREKRALDAQIEVLQENLEVASERVKDIEEEIARWRSEQRPSQQNQTPPFQASLLGRAKQIVEKHKERLEDFKSQLADLNARVAARKEAEEKAERARAEEIPKIAINLANKVESIDPDSFEIIFILAAAKELAAVVLNAREKFNELEIERDYLNRTKGYSIPELRKTKSRVCPDELKAAWKGAFGEHYERRRTVGSRKRVSQVAQMRGELKDLAAEG